MEVCLRKWLENPETQRALWRAARSLVKDVRLKQLSPAFLKQGIPWNETNFANLSEDIRSELILFILEHESKLQNRLTLSGKNCHYYLRRAFINHWIEKTRKPFRDYQRYLYKRAADNLRTSEDFFIFAKSPDGSRFSMVSPCVPIPSLTSEDISEIPFPSRFAESLDYEVINKKAVIRRLAAYFWNRVSGMWENKPVCVDLRDFINWISRHVSIPSTTPVKRLTDENDAWEICPDHSQRPDSLYFDPEQIKKWAGNFACRLNEKEKAVFVLRHRDGLCLKDIAELLGYKGSSGPKYFLDRAEHKLKFFLRDLPWLSPDDLNEEAFSLFRETLLELMRDA
jgi:hypothetical protein